MPGRMGTDRVTVQNLKILKVRPSGQLQQGSHDVHMYSMYVSYVPTVIIGSRFGERPGGWFPGEREREIETLPTHALNAPFYVCPVRLQTTRWMDPINAINYNYIASLYCYIETVLEIMACFGAVAKIRYVPDDVWAIFGYPLTYSIACSQ